MRRLLATYLPRVKFLLAGVVVFQAAQAVLMLTLPGITADIIDNGVLPGDTDYVWRRGAAMLAVTVLQALSQFTAIWFAARAAMAVGRDVRKDLFHRVIGFSAREVDQFGPPTLITRITNDVQQVQQMLLMASSMAISAPMMAVFGIVMATRQDAGLTWVLLVAIPAFAIPIAILLIRATPVFTAMQDQIDRVNQVMREQITGLRVVRAFVRERVERQRFRVANEALTATSITQGRLFAAFFPLTLTVQNLASIAIVWVGAGRIDSGDSSVGSLFAFLGYVVYVLMAVMMASWAVVMLPRAFVSGQRITDVLDTESSVVVARTPVRDVAPRGLVELRAATFSYPGAHEPVLHDVSLVAEPGRTTAIIGSTGAGKSTLLNLIPRLMDVTGGAVLVDGVDVRDFEPEELWSRMGLVPQRPFLFAGTIESNLRVGKPDATEDEMWEALTVAQAADFVADMPDGLRSRINQGGTNVSGGQRQRLAIARALIRRPSIYLFDDSFSALDLATDARLRAALVPYTADSTVLVVAQRVSTIRDADQILVLEDGRVVGLGRHDQLLSTCATYAEIVDSQLTAEAAA